MTAACGGRTAPKIELRDGDEPFELDANTPDAELPFDAATLDTNTFDADTFDAAADLDAVVQLDAGQDAGVGELVPRLLTAGRANTCMIDDSVVKCWGSNDSGETAGVATESEYFPRPVTTANLHPAVPVAVSAGDAFVCALFNDGVVDCWGNDDYGQVTGIQYMQATAIAAGGSHVCALDAKNHAWCAGRGTDGQLGYGGPENRTTPVLVQESIHEPRRVALSAIAAGNNHTCALSISSYAWCWGNSDYEQAFLSGDDALEPVESGITRGDAIALGGQHGCVRSAREIWCWGDNSYGQLGRGALAPSFSGVSRKVMFDPPADIVELELGYWHSCAVLADGTLWCWGANTYGQLGTGDVEYRPLPVLVSLPENNVIGVAAGRAHTCAVTSTNDVYCWGDNGNGQLGLGDVTARYRPERVVF